MASEGGTRTTARGTGLGWLLSLVHSHTASCLNASLSSIHTTLIALAGIENPPASPTRSPRHPSSGRTTSVPAQMSSYGTRRSSAQVRDTPTRPQTLSTRCNRACDGSGALLTTRPLVSSFPRADESAVVDHPHPHRGRRASRCVRLLASSLLVRSDSQLERGKVQTAVLYLQDPAPLHLEPAPCRRVGALPVGPSRSLERRRTRPEHKPVDRAPPGRRVRRGGPRRPTSSPAGVRRQAAQGEGADLRVREVRQGLPTLDLPHQTPLGTHGALERGEQVDAEQAPAGPAPRGCRHSRRCVCRVIAPGREVLLARRRLSPFVRPAGRRRVRHQHPRPHQVVRLSSLCALVAPLGRRRLRHLAFRDRRRRERRRRPVSSAACRVGRTRGCRRGRADDGGRNVRSRLGRVGRTSLSAPSTSARLLPRSSSSGLTPNLLSSLHPRLVLLARLLPPRHTLKRLRLRIPLA
ncbi:hypothetical protein AAT19DRAFT_12352 [Rhodotorula toruloides]|uniref:Proteophosphoglycan ppg4 n=1 Tax=Rhodotorula toruloides TaxID=5286 RepID=A0A2T0AG22_RHOTO|nr:hypothetical protein AAT19DRAFT_12352 [Rhodotorula toruloides]